ncbi:unnamed protein product [Peniophora sp. CBMAI 1063]|nr:unnamed protein product [Peniophora sp. CBMAI 1063]
MTPPPKILRKILRGYPLRPAATPQILDTVQYPSIPLQSGVQQVALDNSGPSRATPTNGPHPPSSRSLPDDQPPIDRVQDSGSTERILEGPVVSSPVEGEAGVSVHPLSNTPPPGNWHVDAVHGATTLCLYRFSVD